MSAPAARNVVSWHRRWVRLRKHLTGWLFISLWLVGFLSLVLFPFLASFALSFTRYQLMGSPEFVGLANFEQVFTDDPKFLISMRVTFAYVLMSVPAATVMAIMVAVLLNQRVAGVAFFRGVFYIPAVISSVGLALLWTFILDRHGPLNAILALVGIKGPAWLFDFTWALPSLALMSVFNVGGGMLIILAALQGVPQHLHEAVDLDGGGEWAKFWHVTIPHISPAIFYNVTMGIIGSLQTFQYALIMTDGGPGTATWFYGLYLYKKAFEYYQMDYACTLAWVMFVVITVFTTLNFVAAKHWVYYEAEAA